MSDWYSMRTSEADRERAADVIKAAVAEGRLTWDERSRRLDAVMKAQTYGELQRQTADLPTGAIPHPAHTQSPYASSARPSSEALNAARASIICAAVGPLTCGLTGIPAIITGHLAHRRMRDSADDGWGLATAGLVLGYIQIGFILVVVVGGMAALMLAST